MTQAVQTAPRYTIAVCKGSALIEETKVLLRAWQPTESLGDFRNRVIREDLLGRTTAYRASDIVRRVFARRLLAPDPQPAILLKRLLAGKQSARLVSDLLLLYAARQDDVLRDVIVDVYWPAVRDGRVILTPRQVVAFLRQAAAEGKMARRWSEQVRLKVARGLLGALVGFGLMKQAGRTRETVYFHPADGAVVYLAHELHFSGLTDAAVAAHRDWALFGFRPSDVVAALDRLSGERWWLAQAAGSVVRITWKYASLQEVVDALAR